MADRAERHVRRVVTAVVLHGALALALASDGRAQGVRVTGTTVVRYVELRPMITDSVRVEDTIEGEGSLRLTSEGIVVRCVPGELFCRYRRTTEPVSTVPVIQDLEISAWGFGEGIQLYAQLRGRTAMGDATELWPLAEQELQALAAYVEVDREIGRVRAGRQWITAGLGFYNFDGGAVLWRARPWLDLDVYGGWSLARAVNEPHTSDAIAAIEDLAPDKRALVVGGIVRARPTPRTSASLQYQREIRTDRGALYSERIAVDAEHRLGRQALVSGTAQLDLASGNVNDARLRGRVPFPWYSGLALDAELRRYQPFFELWTIWGAFAPVGYSEASLGALLTRFDGRLSLQGRAAFRRYGDTGAGLNFDPLRDDGWRLSGDVAWRATPTIVAHAGLSTDIGFGAARSDADAGVRWEPNERVWLGARGTAFQTAYELRVGTGRVLGAGLDGGVRLFRDVRLAGDLAVYRQTFGDDAPATDWSQVRSSLRLEWTLGNDPGLSPERAP
jgi:hypothetical protein